MRPTTLTPTLGVSVLLSACGNSAEVTQKTETLYQCINAPTSIKQTFDLAAQENRVPIYISPDNSTQYADTDWYKSHKDMFENILWEREDWSTILDLSECDQALKIIEADYPKSEDVKRLRNFLNFTKTLHKKYGTAQLEDSEGELQVMMSDAQSCLLVKSYPQAFISSQYDATIEYYPALFGIDWDDVTLDADGRDPLWRPIQTVSETGCLTDLETQNSAWVSHALSAEDGIMITWSEFREYEARFKDIDKTVTAYNAIVTDQHTALSNTGYEIPKKAPYTAPTIYRDNNYKYFSDWDIKSLQRECESGEVKTFVNDRGQTLTSKPRSCSTLNQICHADDITPQLNYRVCEPYREK